VKILHRIARIIQLALSVVLVRSLGSLSTIVSRVLCMLSCVLCPDARVTKNYLERATTVVVVLVATSTVRVADTPSTVATLLD
jgi:hypothetical protein